MKWLRSQKLEHREQRMALKSFWRACARRVNVWNVCSRRSPQGSTRVVLAELVTAVQAMREFDLIAAVTVVAKNR
jgi:transposase